MVIWAILAGLVITAVITLLAVKASRFDTVTSDAVKVDVRDLPPFSHVWFKAPKTNGKNYRVRPATPAFTVRENPEITVPRFVGNELWLIITEPRLHGDSLELTFDFSKLFNPSMKEAYLVIDSVNPVLEVPPGMLRSVGRGGNGIVYLENIHASRLDTHVSNRIIAHGCVIDTIVSTRNRDGAFVFEKGSQIGTLDLAIVPKKTRVKCSDTSRIGLLRLGPLEPGTEANLLDAVIDTIGLTKLEYENFRLNTNSYIPIKSL